MLFDMKKQILNTYPTQVNSSKSLNSWRKLTDEFGHLTSNARGIITNNYDLICLSKRGSHFCCHLQHKKQSPDE